MFPGENAVAPVHKIRAVAEYFNFCSTESAPKWRHTDWIFNYDSETISTMWNLLFTGANKCSDKVWQHNKIYNNISSEIITSQKTSVSCLLVFAGCSLLGSSSRSVDVFSASNWQASANSKTLVQTCYLNAAVTYAVVFNSSWTISFQYVFQNI